MSIVICIGQPTIDRAAKGEMVEVGQGVTVMAADDLHHASPYAEIERLRAALAEQDDFILKFIPADRNGDWACAQCKPHSDMIEEGFMCGLHRAAARASQQPQTSTRPSCP